MATVAYWLARPGQVTIRVYNLLGTPVGRIDEARGPGWQRSPLTLSSYAPGTYFFTLSVDHDSGAKETRPPVKFAVIH
jgi:hypothetical protein